MNEFRYRSKKTDEIWLLSYADLITNLLIFFIALFTMADISRARMEKIQESLSGKTPAVSLKTVQKDVQETIVAQGLENVVKVELSDSGVEISLNSGVVFPVGSELIEERWKPVLSELMLRVAHYADKYEFAVEGHTDDTPIKSGGRFLSNWELASARAHQIRHILEQRGVPGPRLRVESYGETRHLAPTLVQGLSPEEVKSRHRRVVIRIF